MVSGETRPEPYIWSLENKAVALEKSFPSKPLTREPRYLVQHLPKIRQGKFTISLRMHFNIVAVFFAPGDRSHMSWELGCLGA